MVYPWWFLAAFALCFVCLGLAMLGMIVQIVLDTWRRKY